MLLFCQRQLSKTSIPQQQQQFCASSSSKKRSWRIAFLSTLSSSLPQSVMMMMFWMFLWSASGDGGCTTFVFVESCCYIGSSSIISAYKSVVLLSSQQKNRRNNNNRQYTVVFRIQQPGQQLQSPLYYYESDNNADENALSHRHNADSDNDGEEVKRVQQLQGVESSMTEQPPMPFKSVKIDSTTTTRSSSTTTTPTPTPSTTVVVVGVVQRRQRQIRRQPIVRRPRYYWSNPENLRQELVQFWIDCCCGYYVSSSPSSSLSSSTTATTNNSTAAPCTTTAPTHQQQQLLQLPTIPSEVLLMHFRRHDIRAAITKMGGRSNVSRILGGAPIMPGPWRLAIQSPGPELQQLLLLLQQQQRLNSSSSNKNESITTTLISTDRSSPWIRTGDGSNHRTSNNNNDDVSMPAWIEVASLSSWSSSNATTTDATEQKLKNAKKKKRRIGSWSLQIVIRELYEYVDMYKATHHRPSVWMPRPSELAQYGRDDIRQAMNRYGGTNTICRTAGMVPYREWYFFEGQYELLIELKRYLDEYADGNYDFFPTVLDVQRHGYHQLYSLIQYYGGRKFLAARLSMSHQYRRESSSVHENTTSNRNQERSTDTDNGGSMDTMKFGSFDLVFAIRLLAFVREDHMKRHPPLKHAVLSMPSRAKLLSSDDDGQWLVTKIDEYGGHENVARRLGLALFV